jgi:hypothetical protein
MTKASPTRRNARRGVATSKPDAPFDLFQPGVITPVDDELIDRTVAEFPGVSREDIVRQFADLQNDRVFINSRYQVNMRDAPAIAPGWPDMIHLSIKRRDKERVGPEKYRDFMAIKDRLIGPDHEAVELYPARSREYDTANQYHLYVVKDPVVRFPLGFDFGESVVSEHADVGASKQHPFDQPHHRVSS